MNTPVEIKRSMTAGDKIITQLLDYWQDIELLSAEDIQGYYEALKNQQANAKPDGDKPFALVCRNKGLVPDPLPWEARWSSPKYGARMHTVYFGIYDHRNIEHAIKKTFLDGETDQGRSSSGKYGAICAFTVTDTGMFVKQNDFAFGTAPWTITKILASPDNTIPKAKEFFAHEKSAREQIFDLWWQNQGHRSDTSAKSELDNEVIEAWDATEEYPEIRVKWKNLQFLAEFFKSEISALQAQPVAVVVSKTISVASGDIFQPEACLCNYTLRDLRDLSDCFPSIATAKAFDRFLSFSEPTSPLDLINSDEGKNLLKSLTHPNKFPSGRWPNGADSAPNYRQQAGINLIFDHTRWNSGAGDEDYGPGASGDLLSGDIFSINGPPGTGKTFMVRELLACIYTDRAKLLARYENPNDAFIETKSGEQRLHPDFERFGVVLASNNNQALQNITLEIPKVESVDEAFMHGVDLFGDVGTRMLDGFLQKKKTTAQRKFVEFDNEENEPPPKAWGVIAATLGNAGNTKSFWWRGWKGTRTKEDGDSWHPSLERILSSGQKTTPWEIAKHNFLQQLDRVDEITRIVSAAANKADIPGGLRHFSEEADAIYTEALSQEAEGEGSKPWATTTWAKERALLFAAAANLHKSFVMTTRGKLLPMLEKGMDGLVKRAALREASPEEQRNVWAAFFLLVPLISTTFASLQRLFPFTPKAAGTIPWLVIDEASQSTPQQAAGAIYCARRVVVLGDTQQLPPVITIPRAVHRIIQKRHIENFPGARGEWLRHTQSLQYVADTTCRYGAYRKNAEGKSVWVGFPLLYHLRCQSPIFEMFTETFYGGQLVKGTKERKNLIPQSAWLHVESSLMDFQSDSRYSTQEGVVAESIYTSLLRRGLAPSDILLVSPFRDISNALGRLEAVKNNPANHKNFGTVHCSQGREAAAVILVLGTHKTQGKARAWCCHESANLLNVAFTRAKCGLYIVGNYDFWHQETVIQNIMAFLPKSSYEELFAV